MKKYNKPNRKEWTKLIQRPVFDKTSLVQTVSSILENVKQNGDVALKKYTAEFDGIKLNDLAVSEAEIVKARNEVSQELKAAIQVAYDNIKKFHEAQQLENTEIETTTGVKCWRKSVAIEKVGLYIPGGTAPLFSTILMLGIPAKIAGCQEIILCTPCDMKGEINTAILYTVELVGIKKIYKLGGAQAIAAMSFGTETIPQVYKIFGPGNQYVTKAKELVQANGVAIDMPAGPSELFVIADKTCNPEFVAADLLSQCEHGIDSQVILLSGNQSIIDKTVIAINEQVENLPRKAIALQALHNSKAILLDTIQDCIQFSNLYAPEHLILAIDNVKKQSNNITNAGSVFLGNYSCESAGDYASGTNHTLPTNGFAKNYSGVSLDSFVKKITFQEITKTGLNNIGKAIEVMAEAEELIAHKNAVTIRLQSIKNESNV